MDLITAPFNYAQAKCPRFVAALEEFIRFPTISAQPKHADDLKRCTEWLAGHWHQVGLEHVKLVSTRRHPIVYTNWQHAPQRPTGRICGHYYVQPPDPLHEWRSPPFEPAVRGIDLCGRGASDDKGQLFIYVKDMME